MEILKGLGTAALNPMAFVAYIVATLAWLYLRQRVERNKGLLSKIDKLPEKDRLDALRAEMGSVRVSGLNAEQWIRSRIHLYYFLSFAILCLLVSVLFAISAFKNANVITSDPTTSKTITIQGSVRDKTTNLSLKNATVSLVGRADVPSVLTDSNGNFVLTIPRPSPNATGVSATIQVNQSGYEDWSSARILSSDVPLTDILLLPTKQQPSEEMRIDGQWKATQAIWIWPSMAGDYRPMKIDFQSLGTSLFGTVTIPRSQTDESYQVLDGKLSGNKIAFRVQRESNLSSGKSEMHSTTFVGQLKNNELQFSVQDDWGEPPQAVHLKRVSP
jgi:hypothetical protein